MRSFLALCILAIVAAAGDRASAQANVTENQSTTVYVDATAGSDSNTGAQSSPFKTVQAAIKAVAAVHVNSFGYGPVTLKAEGMPSGVGASLSQATLTSGVVTLTFNSSKTAAAQTVPITLFGVSGSRVHSATFYLHVNPL